MTAGIAHTPARITYYIGEDKQDLRFHAVISEAHQATSEVTKFPVQTGFQISNHAIRKNRVITIEAVISNRLIEGSETAYLYSSSNNSKTIFNTLRDLVNLRIKTTVLTNLGVYTPVLFTSFKTKQAAGLVDSMKVILTGEELQVSNAINGTAPTPISWIPFTPNQREAIIDKLNDLGYKFARSQGLLYSTVNLGTDFSIPNTNDLGQTFTTTYIATGHDPTTDTYDYEVHTTDTDLYKNPEDEVAGVAEDVLPVDQSAGAKRVTSCIRNGFTDILEDAAIEYLDTATGELKKTLRGALYGTMAMSNNDVGQKLIGLTAGCAIRGITGFEGDNPYLPGEALPTSEQILTGAKRVGASLQSGNLTAKGIPITETTLIRIV